MTPRLRAWRLSLDSLWSYLRPWTKRTLQGLEDQGKDYSNRHRESWSHRGKRLCRLWIVYVANERVHMQVQQRRALSLKERERSTLSTVVTTINMCVPPGLFFLSSCCDHPPPHIWHAASDFSWHYTFHHVVTKTSPRFLLDGMHPFILFRTTEHLNGFKYFCCQKECSDKHLCA